MEKKFKIRCSALGDFLSGTVGLTDAQKRNLNDLTVKRGVKPLTVLQEETYQDLLFKQLNPELPNSVKTYLDKWIKDELLYKKRTQIHSKYTVKGILNESENIFYASKHLNWGSVDKNEEELENEWLTGTPDVRLADEVIDIKSSFSHDTFPLLESECPSKDYICQVRGYMELDNKSKGSVCYVLSTSPSHLIEREINNESFNFGYDRDDNEFRQSIIDLYSYDEYPSGLRIKTFNIEKDDAFMDEVKMRVKLSRKYITEKLKNFIY